MAGGGTAGHLVPGLAVARALVERGHDPAAIHFAGSRRGPEVEAVPAAGFPLTALAGRGVQRRLTPENVGAVAGIASAAVTAVGLVRRLRPAVVVALGGYASVPCGLAAALCRIPLVVAEQNAVPGLANRLLARFAAASAVSFPGTGLPREVVTGNPVRAEIAAVDRAADRDRARRELDVPEGWPLVVAFGGSLGARRINDAVLGAVGADPGARRIVHHVIGRRDWAREAGRVAELTGIAPGYRPVEYEGAMHRCLAAADLVVARAGASTVAELAVVGVPALLVPLPGAPGDHQTANARALERVGAAEIVADDELTAGRLAADVDRLLADAGRLTTMAAAARTIGRRDAAHRVADLAERHARAGAGGGADR